MIVADVNGAPARATPLAHQTQVCTCRGCGKPVQARCGKQKIWHWAHQQDSDCSYGAGETEWHRSWKAYFDLDELELTLDCWPNNRCDICTVVDPGLPVVIELQHSPIDEETILQREAAYTAICPLVWIVDVSGRSFNLLDDQPGLAYFSWSRASLVWQQATAPVIFDTGAELVYWDRTGENTARSLRSSRCQAILFRRSQTKEELVAVVRAALASIARDKALKLERAEKLANQRARRTRNCISVGSLSLDMSQSSTRNFAIQLLGEKEAMLRWSQKLTTVS